jgi:Resolvase, N terminal domain
MAHKTQEAFTYFRTSSAANVGADKDSDRRQHEAIQAFAKRAGYELAGEYYDAAVSGADPIRRGKASPGCCRRSPAMASGRSSRKRQTASLAT